MLGLETAVDSIRFRLHLRDQILIAFDVRPAWRADLDKAEAPGIGRVLLQKTLDPPKPLGNPFGVIQTVHANADVLRLHAQLLHHPRSLLPPRLVLDEQRCLLEIHADRKWPNQRKMAALINREPLPLD